LKDDDRVVLRSGPGGLEALEVGADGGFIKRLDKVEKRHKRKTQLTKDIDGGTIIAEVIAPERSKKRKR